METNDEAVRRALNTLEKRLCTDFSTHISFQPHEDLFHEIGTRLPWHTEIQVDLSSFHRDNGNNIDHPATNLQNQLNQYRFSYNGQLYEPRVCRLTPPNTVRVRIQPINNKNQ